MPTGYRICNLALRPVECQPPFLSAKRSRSRLVSSTFWARVRVEEAHADLGESWCQVITVFCSPHHAIGVTGARGTDDSGLSPYREFRGFRSVTHTPYTCRQHGTSSRLQQPVPWPCRTSCWLQGEARRRRPT